jgi:hypothetical protein
MACFVVQLTDILRHIFDIFSERNARVLMPAFINIGWSATKMTDADEKIGPDHISSILASSHPPYVRRKRVAARPAFVTLRRYCLCIIPQISQFFQEESDGRVIDRSILIICPFA